MQQKKKICKTCGNERFIWSKGICLPCSRLNFKPIKGKRITKKYKKKAPEENYSEFYLQMLEQFSVFPVSAETGKFISSISGVNIAHIFPKEKYKSVARNPDNIILLAWWEHTRFDELLNNMYFSTLEVEFKGSWQIVCKRVEKLLPLLEETGKLSRNFKKYLDERN